jgi:cytochrome c-type biogenesis protein CcmE
VAALAFGAVAFKNSLVAYMPFSQAVAAASTGSTVQIMGVPVAGKTSFDSGTGDLTFVLREQASGQTMPVVFKSPKPDNFDQAIKIAAIGHYDPASQVFEADNLLVKCPSKYAGDPAATTDRSYKAQQS